MLLWKSWDGKGRRQPRLEILEDRKSVTQACIAAIFGIGIFALQASAGFVAAPSYLAGPSPQSVAVGDFNSDGIPDLAVAGFFGSISIMLGNGDGTFQKPLSLNVGQGGELFGLVVADFNGDGHLDLAATTTAVNATLAGVIILLSNGDGTFQAPQNYAAGPGPLAVGDFNGDGIPDLAVAINNYPNGIVSLLLGNGDGTFRASQNSVTSDPPSSVAVGDFNGDGYLDLVVTNHTTNGTVSILLGNGNGTFQAPRSYMVGSYPAAVAVGDFNSDGFLDLAVANTGTVNLLPSTPGSTLSILLGNGDGTFQAAQDFATGYGPAAVAVGDFNGDGSLDLAVLNAFPYTVSILLGKGDGTFQEAETYAGASGGRYAGTAFPGSLAVGDFNRDGRPDLAVVGEASVLVTGTVGILLGRGDGTFQAAPSYPVSMAPSAVAVADFNGDGIPDLAVTIPGLSNGDNSTNSNAVSILLGNGDGTFQAALSFDAGNQPTSVAVADFNGDGVADLAVTNGFTAVSVGLGHGDGTFGTFRTFALTGAPIGSPPRAVAVGDFNGDGIPDLAVAGFRVLSILLGNGDGTFQTALTFSAGMGITSLAVADFNRDGKLDLVTTNSDIYGSPRIGYSVVESDIRVYLGNGDGTFQAAQIYKAGLGPVSLAVGDFNGDGIPDLATANAGDDPNPGNTVSILLGNGDGGFQAAQDYSTGSAPLSLAVGDFNRDGSLDLAVTSQWGVTILLGDGHGAFRAAGSYAAGGNPSYVVASDLNSDGYPDLTVANNIFLTGPGTVSVLLNDANWVGGP